MPTVKSMSFLPVRLARNACCSALFGLLASGCATHPELPNYDEEHDHEQVVTPASEAAVIPPEEALLVSTSASPIGEPPAGWQPLIIRRDKTLTHYSVAHKQVAAKPTRVLHAAADASASGLWVPMPGAPSASSIAWTWRTDAMIPGADSTRADAEDAPTRVVLAFDGDMSRLPMKERMLAETARMLLGRDMPYATLIYTWDTKQPVGTVIANSHTSRVKKKVVESGPERLGQWLAYKRDYVKDYTEIFGEPPGKLLGVGVLTDTDNTRQRAEAWYGDIRLLTERTTALGNSRGPTAID